TSERNDRIARSGEALLGDASEPKRAFASVSRSVHSRSSAAARLPSECNPNPALARVIQSAEERAASPARRYADRAAAESPARSQAPARANSKSRRRLTSSATSPRAAS